MREEKSHTIPRAYEKDSTLSFTPRRLNQPVKGFPLIFSFPGSSNRIIHRNRYTDWNIITGRYSYAFLIRVHPMIPISAPEPLTFSMEIIVRSRFRSIIASNETARNERRRRIKFCTRNESPLECSSSGTRSQPTIARTCSRANDATVSTCAGS